MSDNNPNLPPPPQGEFDDPLVITDQQNSPASPPPQRQERRCDQAIDQILDSVNRLGDQQVQITQVLQGLGRTLNTIDNRNTQPGAIITRLETKVDRMSVQVDTVNTAVATLANRPGQGPKERWAVLGMLVFICIAVPLCAWLITRNKDTAGATNTNNGGASQNGGQGSGQGGGGRLGQQSGVNPALPPTPPAQPGQISGVQGQPRVEYLSAMPPPINTVLGVTNVINNCNNAVLIVTNACHCQQVPATASTPMPSPAPQPAPAPTTAVPAQDLSPQQTTMYLQMPMPGIPIVVTGPGPVVYSGVTFGTTVLPGPMIPGFEHRRSGFNFGVWRHQKEVWRPVPCPPPGRGHVTPPPTRHH